MIKLKNIFITSVLIIVCTNLVFSQAKEDVFEKINKNMEVFGEVYKEVLLNYVDKVNSDKFFEAGINGMLSTLDPYTTYYGINDRQSLDLITAGKYGGVGISINMDDSTAIITDIMNGYEASRKGLRVGDIIRKIDGTPVAGMSTDVIRKKVRGEVGSKIFFSIERNSELIDFELTRQEIILKDIFYSGFLNEGIAYIKLDRFGGNSDKEFEITLRTLKSQKEITGLIIDLRNNGGGFLNASINILNKLVERNSFLLSTKGYKNGTETKYFSKEEPLITKDIPIAVLINQGTASASEILSGALQDLDRAVIIGVKSFGKGLVQSVRDLNFDTHLKITTARYFTPSGRWIQSKDYFVENKSGVFLNTETFQTKEFKTLNGRPVTANGGITPDIEIKTDGESKIHFALLSKDMFFRYAEYYLQNNSNIKIFNATDATFEDFKNFISSKGFNYKSDAERKLDELKRISKENNFEDKISNNFSSIEDAINKEETIELEKAKEEILRSLEKEINKIIITEKEQIEATFSKDIQLQEALKLIMDKPRYNSILGK